MAAKNVLYQIVCENADEATQEEALVDLKEIATDCGVKLSPPVLRGEPPELDVGDTLEAYARDFADNGHEVDFDDGPCITIYEKVE